MRYFTILAAGVLLLGFASNAWSAPVLFGDFVWGASKSELGNRPGALPGEGPFIGDVHMPETTFAGLPWDVRLGFANDRLVRVSLMGRYSRDRMNAVTKQLRADGFEMLSVLLNSSFLDLVKILKLKGPDGVKEEWARFVKDKKPERMIYAWFDTSNTSEDMKAMVGSLQQLLTMGPIETREAEVILLCDPATSAPGMLLVDFSFPVMQQP